jgi:predicted nucleic acid-binding protein
MKTLRVYLDNCCYNRPFDDQTNVINRIEAEAKLVVQRLIKDGQLELVWSDVVAYENEANPFEERRIKIAEWEQMSATAVEMDNNALETARDLMSRGLRQMDASHVACAIAGKADYFLTVDHKILNKPVTEIPIMNPIDFLKRMANDD